MDEHILALIIPFASCTFLLFAILLWMRRGDNRSRVCFSVAYGVCCIDLFIRIFGVYSGTPLTFEALQPAAIYMALIEVPLFLFYLIEVVNPGWLTWRKALWLCAPWLLWNICLLVSGWQFRELHTFSDIFRHIGEVNVWLRLLFAMLILPYNVLIYLIPYNWRRSSADRELIRIYGGGFIVIALLFVGSSVSGLMPMSSLHLAYGTFFCFSLAYYELFVRLQVPREAIVAENDRVLAPAALPQTPCAAIGETEETEEIAEDSAEEQDIVVKPVKQWSRINRKIEDMRPWRDPNISIIALADLLQTNRTTLTRLFREQGYSEGYKEFINRRRIADFLELMNKHPRMNMQDAFFEVGYRSRMTALRNFKEYMGMGPSEYFGSQDKEEQRA